ncbi:glycosyl transferase [Bacteroides ovatus]|uniref:glycosyl transferase n=1 Tax=Bacteroides ovatus TaxID=28116 RepID=UPI0021666682|nr:glycosyl transferase [Bacteroides ovatus]MCS2298362.1 glycosyl transferase [Bacteroides ovatus]
MKIIVVAPSLDPSKNVSGISSVTKFIISNNKEQEYIHFELGRKDNEEGGIFRIFSILKNMREWKNMLNKEKDAIIHYNFPLSKASILRDPLFMGIALQQKRKMVVHIHGGVFLTHYKEASSFFKWILKKVFSWNVPFIVLGENEKNIIEQTLKAKRVFLLPNCVDLQDAESFERVYNWIEPLNIGYIGRIAVTKGMENLLQACRELKAKQIPFIVKLAGAEEVKDSFLPLFDSYLGHQFIYAGIVSGEKKNIL